MIIVDSLNVQFSVIVCLSQSLKRCSHMQAEIDLKLALVIIIPSHPYSHLSRKSALISSLPIPLQVTQR